MPLEFQGYSHHQAESSLACRSISSRGIEELLSSYPLYSRLDFSLSALFIFIVCSETSFLPLIFLRRPGFHCLAF